MPQPEEPETLGCILDALLTGFMALCTTTVVLGAYWLLWKILEKWYVDYGIWRY